MKTQTSLEMHVRDAQLAWKKHVSPLLHPICTNLFETPSSSSVPMVHPILCQPTTYDPQRPP